jgi:iron complex outermembrane receptor protein
VDVSTSYQFPSTSFGRFRIGLEGTYLTRFDNQLVPDGPWLSNVGQFGWASNGTTNSQPIITYRWKHNLTLSWQYGDWNATLANQFNSKYRDQNTAVTSQYYRDITSFSLWNATTSVKLGKQVTITAGINNLFDKAPPLTNNTVYTYAYLSSAANPTGRAYNLRMSYEFQ